MHAWRCCGWRVKAITALCPILQSSLPCRATAALINSALGSKDVEMAGSALFAPVWIQKSEKIRVDLSVLKDRLNKLKE